MNAIFWLLSHTKPFVYLPKIELVLFWSNNNKTFAVSDSNEIFFTKIAVNYWPCSKAANEVEEAFEIFLKQE